MAVAPSQGAIPLPPAAPAWEEISLADLLTTVWKRRTILVVFVLAGLLAAVALTVLTKPVYQAQATVVPLQQKDIIQNWLGSRQAAQLALPRAGPHVYAQLSPGRWDLTSNRWIGTPPSNESLGTALAGSLKVTASVTSGERLLTLTDQLGDPVATRDALNAYLATLDDLRPELESITRTDAFIKFYDGSNAQEAQRRSEEVAHQTVYWIVLDTPLVPSSPIKPQPVLNVILGLGGGFLAGFLAVFLVEWLGKFRADLQGRDELTLPAPPPEPASAAIGLAPAPPATATSGTAPPLQRSAAAPPPSVAPPAVLPPTTRPPAPPSSSPGLLGAPTRSRQFSVVRGPSQQAAAGEGNGNANARVSTPSGPDPPRRFWQRR